MANLLSTGIYGFLCSLKKEAGKYTEHFLSGFAGYGWKIWERNKRGYCLEIDDIVVRNTMTVFELLIQKIRAVKGALAITQASGKIKNLVDNGDHYRIILEDEMSFVANDIIRCQRFNGDTHSYWVTISEVDGDVIIIPTIEFEMNENGVIDPPRIGDELIQFGNTNPNSGRNSAIYLHADENGIPAIDVMFDITDKTFDGCVKTRLGGALPGEPEQYKGLYCENGMIKSVKNGTTVYQLNPDGSAFFAEGAVRFNTDKSGHIAGGAISWEWNKEKNLYICKMKENVVLQWENLSDETKENLKGDPGIQGPKGESGKTIYFHIKYSPVENPMASQMTETPSTYIGTYVDEFVMDSLDPLDYKWARFQGMMGEQGIPGEKGDEGKTYYLHIKYSNDGGNTFTGNNGEDTGDWIGIYTDTNINDSMDISLYKWSKIRGEDGEDANLLPWVDDWQSNATQIGQDYFISPKIFSGTRDSVNAPLTGVALGHEVLTIVEDGVEKKLTGLFGIKDGNVTFELNSNTGLIKAMKGEIGNFTLNNGSLSAVDAGIEKLRLTTENIGNFSSLSTIGSCSIRKSVGFPNRDTIREGTFQYFAEVEVNQSCVLEFAYSISTQYDSGSAIFNVDCAVFDWYDNELGRVSGYRNEVSVSIPENGVYSIIFTVNIEKGISTDPLIGEWSLLLDDYAKTVVGVKKSIIGLDGIYSYWDATRYMYLSEKDRDFFFRIKGNSILQSPNNQYGLRVVNSGIQKTEDGGISWTNI